MNLRSSIVVAGLSIAAGQAWCQDLPLTEEDILNQIVGKTIQWKMFDGKIVDVELTKAGKATASGAYNDVGKWRMDAPGGYCITWNKAPMNESCVKLIRRDGVLSSVRADGAVRATVVSVQ
ncbi:hypothetical protein QTH97_32355 [Variovorax sp. J22R24]|uniref:hypothetical protein n=1 Tax=Variovorax gracilis TaxID=3053502 RepID=UPI0025773AC7|nr:hypothetical protein [Variovorax sp. J22R24]MDM0109651.1 hypothetical protein [Variovorax sp. J22R24]